MAPIVRSLPSYVKDSQHALQIFRDFNFLGEDKLIFTMDITSLYTVIPNGEGLLALKHFFDLRTLKEPSSETLLRLAELVLTLNCFSFAGSYYKQINGVAMGTKMGPSYANLFVGYIEHKFFNQYNGPKPELYRRYIDDCVGATSSTREELNQFITAVNSFHPALKYTWEISDTSLAFLDIKLSIEGNCLCTSVHYKPTDSHSYLLYSSSHPSHVKNSIPYSQLLRLRRLCSEDSDFFLKSEEMYSETLLRLAELVLTLNCFSFAGSYYKQINGVAMGTKMGPSYANLFVGYIEHKFFNQYNGPKPELYRHYIDDCVGATSSTREELNQFITAVNSFHPALKYTWEISDTSLAFLDIKLSIEGNGLCTSVHYKPTDSHSYLLHSSSHPSHVKNSIPYSQLLRLRRLCSEDSDFFLKSEEMCHFFDKRGYPASVVQAGHHRAQQIDRQSALQTSQKENNNRIPFTLTFHPHNHAVKSIILKNFKLLQNDPDTGRIFSQPPLISFKRDKNIGNFLVRSAFQTSNQAGTFKWARARCKTCPFICNVEKLSGPKRSINITDHFTCTSTNVIYCITCTLCKKLYIGETERRLGDRFREHLRDVEKDDKNASKPVARHFNLPNHSKQHMAVCGLSLHQGSTESRKTLEQKFIFQIGTLNPHGINERFSFN